jgi:predicted ATP-grasp superfamily ATP-dependent carboligase
MGLDRTFDALLTDGRTRSGLAVARSFARRGISVLVAGQKRSNLVLASRSASSSVLGPSPRANPDDFVAFVLETVRAHRIPLVVPVTDADVIALESHRSAVEAETRLAMAGSRAVRSVLDKRTNLEVARRLGVPCPRQFDLEHPGQIPELVRSLGLPVVMKNPGPSVEMRPSPFRFRVLFARTEHEVRELVRLHCPEGVYPLFQECAVGEVRNLCCFAAGGRLLAVHEYHSIRRHEGAGILREIVEPIPELVTHARRLLEALEWDGVAHLGFFLDRERKKIWYMETNGRFWASVEGSVHAGWDFPFWVYDYFRNGAEPHPGRIRLHSKTCWHLGDLLALLEYFRGGDCPSTGAEHGRFRALLAYLSGFAPGIHSDVFRWSDPQPALRENAQAVQRLLGYAGRRVKRLLTGSSAGGPAG